MPTNEEGTQNENTENAGATPTFEEWFDKAEEPVKEIINTRFAALENTVKATRDERDAVTGQVKELLKQAEKGSQAEKLLTETLAKLEMTEKRASFFEDAIKPAVGCRNPKAAFALAVANDLFTRNGNPDWDAIKKDAPELFGAPIPRGHAGSGTEEPPKGEDMNTIIRKLAGVA